MENLVHVWENFRKKSRGQDLIEGGPNTTFKEVSKPRPTVEGHRGEKITD